MAPRGATLSCLAKTATLKKTSSGRVTKPKPRSKPTRGSFKHHISLMNVQPKGKYIRTVNNNQGQSTLLHLPAESRNQIFKYAFEDKVWEIISKIRFGGIVMKKEKNGLGLLGVCRQIYTETASIPYATSTFKFKYPPYLVFYPETYSLPVGSRSLQYILATVPMSGKTTISSSGRAMHFLPTFPRTEDCPCRLFLLAL